MGSWIRAAGRSLPRATRPRATSPVDAGPTVAAIWHDPALNTDPGAGARGLHGRLLALEHGRLEAELACHPRPDRDRRRRATTQGRARSARRCPAESGRGPDQAGNGPGLAPSDSEIAARLAEVGYGLEDAVQELRGLARGIHPPLLRDFGLRRRLRPSRSVRGRRRLDRRRDRPLSGRRREGGLLLLPRIAAEHRQARRRGAHAEVRVAERRTSCASRSSTTASALRSRPCRARGRRGEHGRAGRGASRLLTIDSERPGHAGPRTDPAARLTSPQVGDAATGRVGDRVDMSLSAAPASVPRRSWAARFERRQR